jgi:hypothetical protein
MALVRFQLSTAAPPVSARLLLQLLGGDER